MNIQFTEFVLDTTADDLPDEVLDRARLWLLDLCGVAAAGSETALSGIIRDHAAAQFGAGNRAARMIVDGRRVSPAGAALAGGMTIDAMDAHDGHRLTKGHVGCGVLPALLALAEAEGLEDGGEVLAALVIGYEIGTRAGIALHRTACDYHTSGAWVAVACAALGARIIGLGPDRLMEAVGIAEYHGPRSQMMRCIDHPTMLKDGSGWGAMAGVSAAYLAAAGFTGAPAVTVTGADVADLWSDLGSRWLVLEQYFKPYPVCRWAQPAMRGVLDLRAEHGLVSTDVERIEVATFHESRRLATTRPRTTEEAQYSTAYPAAVAMVKGGCDPADVSEDSFADPEIRRLAEGMVITEDPAFNTAFPARRLARVTLHLADGRAVTSADTEARGDPETPAARSEIVAKYRRYAQPVLGTERASALEAAVAGLGDGAGLEPLLDALAPGA
ncbi:MmgE/PrpD family protein [Roseibacterium sp. SDUM158016]|uniref:MmgE/PrpD family protein n=1 Tax=Roseicyclus sediminis TaxID=2980997 RepID=UPI0021D0F7C3|nr:MmgE/PrpD family protein [Roseibacterium sp. SDUM158016]MCU4651648.1 MmgE/PrpD family protein [Roseibacterium sp. SDUM158016]